LTATDESVQAGCGTRRTAINRMFSRHGSTQQPSRRTSFVGHTSVCHSDVLALQEIALPMTLSLL